MRKQRLAVSTNGTLASAEGLAPAAQSRYLHFGDNGGMRCTMLLWKALACALMANVLLSGSSVAAEPALPDRCYLVLASRFVGARAVPTVRRNIRAIVKHRPVRWIAPGRAIQFNFNALRLNVILSETGRITAMRCG